MEFRKSLKRERRRAARAEKEKADAANNVQRQRIEALVREAKEEGFPTDVEEKEAYFMEQVARGEALCAAGKSTISYGDKCKLTVVGPEGGIDAALCFYKALKVYPQPKDLINIYDKTVPKVKRP